jgi:hypothetical protein
LSQLRLFALCLLGCWLFSSLAWAEPTMMVKDRQRKNLNHIYSFDQAPLGSRIPLILLPGRAEEYQQNAWWEAFNKDLRKNPALISRYKPYVYIYNSKDKLNVQVQRFVESYQQAGFKQPSVWVSYSLGGVIAREAFLHPTVLPQVNTHIAIAVPFHGSPIFNPEWFSQYLQPRNHSPVRRFSDRFLYRLYLFDKTNLLEGLRWNNFDGSSPDFGPKRPLQKPIAVYEPFWSNPERTAQFKRRTIAYACFLDNPYTGRPLINKSMLAHAERLTKDLLTSILPFDWISVHAVVRYTNLQLANLPSDQPGSDEPTNYHLYRYNDGVVPVSSALYLPHRPDQPYNEQIDDLWKLADVQKVRVFKNWDHMEIGEYFAWNRKTALKDLAHDKEEAKTPNAWVFKDLLDIQNLSAHVDTTPSLARTVAGRAASTALGVPRCAARLSVSGQSAGSQHIAACAPAFTH